MLRTPFRRFRRRSRPLLVLVLLVLLAWLPAHAQLPDPVLQALRTANIPEDAVSALVLRDDATILSHLADRPVQPASTMKLVTTLVALERLGPVFRGRTELRSAGVLDGDTLTGDLYLRGGADADLSTEALDAMLRTLRHQGIRRIDGRLVIDRQLFNPARLDTGPGQFDDAPEAYYNVSPDAALINKNMLQLDMRSTSGTLKLVMEPALQGVTIGSDMTLVNADCASWEDGWQRPEAMTMPDGAIRVMLHGTFPKQCAATYAINVIDRQAYVDRLLRTEWKRLGGSFVGTSRHDTAEDATPGATRLLAEHTARALPEIVRDTNKPSDNLLARTLFLSLGALESDPVLGSHPQPAGTDTTFVRADAAVRAWMRQHGIDDTGLVLENGSGLSRTERITPIQLGGVLRAGLRSDWAPEFQASMPIMAVDGTMRRRLHDSPAAGRARMKSGTLNNVAAIAGYVPDAGGRPCIVVAMVNSDLVSNGRGRAVLDALVDWVARLNAPPVQPVPPVPSGPPVPSMLPVRLQPATHGGGA